MASWSRSEFVLGLSATKEHTLTETLVPTLLFAFFSGYLDRSLLLEFACHAAGAGGVLLCIMATCFETVEIVLSTGNFALRLF
jgi:hypothetical protein